MGIAVSTLCIGILTPLIPLLYFACASARHSIVTDQYCDLLDALRLARAAEPSFVAWRCGLEQRWRHSGIRKEKAYKMFLTEGTGFADEMPEDCPQESSLQEASPTKQHTIALNKSREFVKSKNMPVIEVFLAIWAQLKQLRAAWEERRHRLRVANDKILGKASLMRLPVELRLEILGYLVNFDEPISLDMIFDMPARSEWYGAAAIESEARRREEEGTSLPRPAPYFLKPDSVAAALNTTAVLRTCSTLRNEGLTVLFETNDIRLESESSRASWRMFKAMSLRSDSKLRRSAMMWYHLGRGQVIALPIDRHWRSRIRSIVVNVDLIGHVRFLDTQFAWSTNRHPRSDYNRPRFRKVSLFNQVGGHYIAHPNIPKPIANRRVIGALLLLRCLNTLGLDNLHSVVLQISTEDDSLFPGEDYIEDVRSGRRMLQRINRPERFWIASETVTQAMMPLGRGVVFPFPFTWPSNRIPWAERFLNLALPYAHDLRVEARRFKVCVKDHGDEVVERAIEGAVRLRG